MSQIKKHCVMIANQLLLSFIISITVSYCDVQNIGDICTIQNSNSQGVCEIISKCPKAIDDLKKSIRPTSCGFDGTTPIVCCVKSNTVGDTSREKCKEYGTHVFQLETFPGSSEKRNKSTCRFPTLIIAGGEKALLNEFPHQAILGYDVNGGLKWQCGGALISEEYVVTAAHCLDAGVNGGKVKYIRLGDLNYERTDDDARPQTFTIKRSIPHPDYKPPSRYNDIALLQLNKPVVFDKFIRPICLQTEFVMNDNRVIATGYGRTKYAGDQSSDLLKVQLEYFTHNECTTTYRTISKRLLPSGIDDQTHICAGSKTKEKDTCQGDSGGPLQVYHPDVYCMYKLIGVTSFGKACATIGVPGVYTRVSNYIEWIEKEVWGVHS